MKPVRAWRIEGHDGSCKIFQFEVAATSISHNQIPHLLKALLAKHGRIDDEDIAACFTRPMARMHRPELNVTRWTSGKSERPRDFVCGTDPCIIASLVDCTRSSVQGTERQIE